MNDELNYFGNQKYNNAIESESFNFFLKEKTDTNFSIFSYLFYGINKTITKCLGCGTNIYKFDYFQILNFPLLNFHNKNFNIYNGFKEFVKTKILKESEQFYCQICRHLKDAELHTQISYTPPILIINFDYGKNKKNRPNRFDFGECIDLLDFTDDKCNERTYKLIGVLCSNNINSGNNDYYFSYCKDKYNCWHRFNDSSIADCKYEEVFSSNIKILFYKKVKDLEHNQ